MFVVDAEGAAHSAARLPGYLARPRERYNDDTRDLKRGLAIRRFVGFVNVGGASRFRRVSLVDGPLWSLVCFKRRKSRYLQFLAGLQGLGLEGRRCWRNW